MINVFPGKLKQDRAVTRQAKYPQLLVKEGHLIVALAPTKSYAGNK